MIIFASVQLNFKPCNFTIKNTNGNALIFDIIRKKYVALTPEEWVRQHVLQRLDLLRSLSLPEIDAFASVAGRRMAAGRACRRSAPCPCLKV